MSFDKKLDTLGFYSTSICESFRWMQGIDSFKTQPKHNNQITIKGVAARADAISKNGRRYIGEELKRAARTMVGKSVTINHQDNHKVGKIDWAEYEDDQLEYLATIYKAPYVEMLRNHSTDIKGVSIQASYLALECVKCHKKFTSQEEWAAHMKNDEFVNNMGLETPHGIFFGECALSLVLGNEVPGLDTTIQIAESVHGFQQLCETFLAEKGIVDDAEAVTPEKPIEPTEEQIVATQISFLENHSDPKVRETFKALLEIMDKRVSEAEDLHHVKETVDKVKQLESNLEQKTTTITELQSNLTEAVGIAETLKKEVTRRDGIVEENRKLTIENENLRDKLKPQFKGHSKLAETVNNRPVIGDPMKGK